MSRRKFSERDVLAVVHHNHTTLLCYRCKKPLEPGQDIQREHLTEIAIGGADEPVNCAYSHRACHDLVTNGPPSTSAGSSKNRIAKATNPDRMPALVSESLTIEQKRERKASRVHRPMVPVKRASNARDIRE